MFCIGIKKSEFVEAVPDRLTGQQKARKHKNRAPVT